MTKSSGKAHIFGGYLGFNSYDNCKYGRFFRKKKWA
jgi:hypothetical protein